MRVSPRTTVPPLAAALLAGVLAGCTGDVLGSPDPGDTAAQLAEALSQRTVGQVPFTGTADPQAWLDRLVEGLGDAAAEVSVLDVEEEGDTATAQLAWTWNLAEDASWSYESSARLRMVDDEWTVVARPSLVSAKLRKGERLRLVDVPPRRADIVGAAGRPLVQARPVRRIGVDKTAVGPARQPSSARALARLVDVAPATFVARVRESGPEAFVEAIVLREAEVSPSLLAAVDEVRGARALTDSLPLAVTRDFARPILGIVGEVTAEIVEASGGFYGPGAEAGLTGLQERYDERLRGEAGLRVEVLEPSGLTRRVFSTEPTRAEPLRTTLDARRQTIAERLLADVGPASAIVAVRPSDGDILVAASGPGSDGLSTATVGQYAPGSTFKVVSSLALLRSGLTPGSTVSCPPSVEVNGRRFSNYGDYPSAGLGAIELRRAVANSCNTAFIGQRGRLTPAAVADAAASLGLGVDHDMGFPVYFGSVPARASRVEHAASLIGQGKVLASPVAMAAVAASVASGETVVPRLVPDEVQVAAAPATPLTSGEAGSLRELMRGVVQSGSASFLADVPGTPVLAKTGTAEFGTQPPLPTHAWMIGVQGDLAVAVFVEVGQSGSRTAGPILEAFLRQAG